MRDVLRSYQDAVTGAIARFGGYTAKLMGDGILAYLGWPHAQEDSAGRAVRAGFEITALVPRLASANGPPLSARVGIATGLVVVGDLIGKGAGPGAGRRRGDARPGGTPASSRRAGNRADRRVDQTPPRGRLPA